MTLVKWIPRTSLINDFDNMLDTMFNDGWNGSLIRNNNLSVDIIEKKNEFDLTADLPGFEKKEITRAEYYKAEKALRNFKTQEELGKLLGISSGTINKIMKEYPDYFLKQQTNFLKRYQQEN